MDLYRFVEIKESVIKEGYEAELNWANNIEPCVNADDFFGEFMWVVLTAGMKEQVARLIQGRIYAAWENGEDTASAFGHAGKVEAIDYVNAMKDDLFDQYQRAEDKLDYLTTLPWIGDITKYHLAKNLGVDIVKPDRHLTRIAAHYGLDCFELCRRLAVKTGYRLAAVDQILWRAGNLGLA